MKTFSSATHGELLNELRETLAKNGTQFQGSIEWHMEWVKLDLEARKEIIRSATKASIEYTLA